MQRRTSALPKKKMRPVHLERRVRVTFFLPAETQEEKEALRDVGGYLLGKLKNPVLPITGFTRSAVLREHPLFKGYWWSEKEDGTRILAIEDVVLFLIDFSALTEEWKLDQELVRLKTEILACYAKHHCPQEEIWIVKEDIHRYA